ncbi:MAG: hypothetical protein Q4Q17_04670 [Tissierellia bacterium]|nr:hypothetical protein [Tissierellia bacterium]
MDQKTILEKVLQYEESKLFSVFKRIEKQKRIELGNGHFTLTMICKRSIRTCC